MKITSKEQVTIPVEIRQKLGLTPNTEVEFEVTGDSVYLKKARVFPPFPKHLYILTVVLLSCPTI